MRVRAITTGLQDLMRVLAVSDDGGEAADDEDESSEGEDMEAEAGSQASGEESGSSDEEGGSDAGVDFSRLVEAAAAPEVRQQAGPSETEVQCSGRRSHP